MSRVTAPVSKISRALSAGPATIRAANPLLDSTAHTHHAGAGASLMPKYAELLREHSDSSRGLTTTHRPTPQPSISNRTKPLMQTFHSSASASSPAVASTNLDATVLPSLDFESTVVSSGFRMPLLPDNYNTAHGPTTADGPVTKASIVAADPAVVAPGTPLSAVEGINLDGIELKFVHEQEAQPEEHSSMLKDLWKGMVDDVLGPAKKTA